MRILWQSASPFCTSGYGMQTASVTRQLKRAGHDVAILCFFGIQGAMVDWGDIPIYANDKEGYGSEVSGDYCDHWKADLLISLVDAWVLKKTRADLNWFPWTPVDHDPVPPRVLEVVKTHPAVIKPIAMSRHGQRMLADQDVDSYYIPHSIDCRLFSPSEEARAQARGVATWEDKFVVGTVATNTTRKNWNASMIAMREFVKRHDDVRWYMHTPAFDRMGFDLNACRMAHGLKQCTAMPDQMNLKIGIPQQVMVSAYNCMDVFLLASRGEGFGIPALEAQACGVPVILADNTAQSEMIGGGWKLEKQTPTWTLQDSFEFDSDPDEILKCLEEAYQAKQDGSIAEKKQAAREFALGYDEPKVFNEYWIPTLADMEKRVHEARNLEGVQPWRKQLVPRHCSPKKVLDVGCGTTQPYRKLLEKLGEYVGVDLKEGAGIVQADAHKLPFKAGEFGFVWCSELLEHVENPEQVLNECKRVGVHGVITFPTPENRFFHVDKTHKEVTLEYIPLGNGDGMITW